MLGEGLDLVGLVGMMVGAEGDDADVPRLIGADLDVLSVEVAEPEVLHLGNAAVPLRVVGQDHVGQQRAGAIGRLGHRCGMHAFVGVAVVEWQSEQRMRKPVSLSEGNSQAPRDKRHLKTFLP